MHSRQRQFSLSRGAPHLPPLQTYTHPPHIERLLETRDTTQEVRLLACKTHTK